MVDREWIEHRRPDGEVIGWMRPERHAFVAIDRLGRARTGAVDWPTAEQALDELGLSYLAEPFELRRDDGSWLRVRVVEASPTHIRVKKEDFGAAGRPVVEHTLPFPPGDRLREYRPAPTA